jgi:hypothetical protein
MPPRMENGDTISDKDVDEMNEAIASHVNRESQVQMSSTRVHGRFTLRFIALAQRTHIQHVDIALTSLQYAAKVVLNDYRTNRSLRLANHTSATTPS